MIDDDYPLNKTIEVLDWIGENWLWVLVFLYLATCVVRCGWDG